MSSFVVRVAHLPTASVATQTPHPENSAPSLAETCKLLFVESIIPPDSEPSGAKFTDVLMLVGSGGQERTKTEYRWLLRPDRFELTRVLPTASMVSIIEGVEQ